MINARVMLNGSLEQIKLLDSSLSTVFAMSSEPTAWKVLFESITNNPDSLLAIRGNKYSWTVISNLYYSAVEFISNILSQVIQPEGKHWTEQLDEMANGELATTSKVKGINNPLLESIYSEMLTDLASPIKALTMEEITTSKISPEVFGAIEPEAVKQTLKLMLSIDFCRSLFEILGSDPATVGDHLAEWILPCPALVKSNDFPISCHMCPEGIEVSCGGINMLFSRYFCCDCFYVEI